MSNERGDMLLASLDELKAYKDIKKDDDDASLMLILEASSNLFKEQTRRSFIDYWDTSKIEYHDAYENYIIYTDEFPIREIEKIEFSYNGDFRTDINGDYIADIPPITLEEYTDYLVNMKQNTFSIIQPFTVIPNTMNTKITYTAGYKTTPSDILMAVCDLAIYYRDSQSVPRKSLDGASVENLGFRSSDSGLPAHIRRVLEFYRVSI